MACENRLLFELILGLAVIVGIVKLYFKFKIKWNKSKITLYGKTAIVTGANTGMGYETAMDLASRGARVILACRNRQRANEAKRKIRTETRNDNVVVRILDFESLNSVRDFVKDIYITESRLDVLVNNAGAMHLGNYKTKDGLHILMQVNYFGPFLLTYLLLDLLRKSSPSRIVNVSSTAAEYANLDIDNINNPSGGSLLARTVGIDYCNAKLCNILMSNELAQKLTDTGVVSNSLHPGAVRSNIGRSCAGTLKKLMAFLLDPILLTPEEGAQTQIYCAVARQMEHVRGKYLSNLQISNMPKTVTRDLAKKLWGKSEELVKLTPRERQIDIQVTLPSDSD